MAIWLVRAGKFGGEQAFALDNNVAVVKWTGLTDLGPIKTRTDLEHLLRKTYPEAKPGLIRNNLGQLWAFRNNIQTGDLIILPLKGQSAIAIGKVTGPYQFRPDFPEEARHTRPVQWLRKDIPRGAFDQDLLYSLGTFMTVCQISRNNAEERIRALLKGHPLPLPLSDTPSDDPIEAEPVPVDLEQYALDKIRDYVGRQYKGHGLARLVDAVLKAQGYQTQLSPMGPDGGVDVIAGQGPMGFEAPRLCVQVKSSDQPLGVAPLRELQGVLKNFGAQQGLLVAWGGFNQPVRAEARRLFFEIRLWDADDLVRVLLEQYDRLPEDLRAELPLKRIWTLVPEEEL